MLQILRGEWPWFVVKRGYGTSSTGSSLAGLEFECPSLALAPRGGGCFVLHTSAIVTKHTLVQPFNYNYEPRIILCNNVHLRSTRRPNNQSLVNRLFERLYRLTRRLKS